MSKLGLVKEVIKGAKEAKPFFSAADKAATELKRGKGTGKEFMTELKKTPGVKAAEIQDRKLAEIEAMPKMTKEEFLAELEKRPPPQIQESGYTEELGQEIFSDAFRKAVGHLPENEQSRAWSAIPKKERDRLLEEAAPHTIYDEGTKFNRPDLKLPGGENYREILLKLPRSGLSEKEVADKMYLEAKARRGNLTSEQQTKLDELTQREQVAAPAYLSSHWPDDPNVLAHVRVTDRTGPNGELVLHVEEIQSDWHQAGRKQGYFSGARPKVSGQIRQEPNGSYSVVWDDGVVNTGHDLESAQRAIERGKPSKEGVPDAPFKKSWHELAMKRLLNYAAEHGYDKVAITPGAEQASRYDLSKHVDELLYKKNPDGTYKLSAQARGRGHMIGESISPEELDRYVGKDVAERIIEGQGKKTQVQGKYDPVSMTGSMDTMQSLSGLDLQVGGEGMKGFYDKMLPDYLNSFGKKYGVQVTPYDIETHPAKTTPQVAAPGIDYYPEPIVEPAKTARVHSFDITPEMREDIKGGMPLYQKIGIPTGAGAAGSEMQMPELPEQLEQTEEPAFADGGQVGEEYDPDQSDGGLVVHDTASFKRGGKVKISDNPDAMFLELQDKELNRK